MFGEISGFFEVKRENQAGMALQQALERLHYRDSLCGRTCATLTHKLGVTIYQKQRFSNMRHSWR
jgi:hypothetical protein